MSKLSQKELCFSSSPDFFKEEVKVVLSSVREQLDDHLTAINENTNEIASNFEALCEINEKLEKLFERLERVESFLSISQSAPVFAVKPLSSREKELFMALYSLLEAVPYVGYQQLARKLCWTEPLVASYITNLIAKGMPVQKRFINNKVVLSLDPRFRDLQARKNILKVDARLTQWI